MSGLSAAQLNTGTGGINLGIDDVIIGGTATDFQIVKIGFSDAGAQPVQVGPSNSLPVTVTGTAAVVVQNVLSKHPVSVAGADGTVNIVGTVPVSLSGANGTVNLVGTPAVQLSGANGTVNIVGTVPVSLSAANGTINIAGTLGTINVNNFPVTQAVSVSGANGTVNIVGTVPVSLSAANGTVNIQGTPSVLVTGANGTVNVVGTVPILHAASSTFTLGTVALAGTPGVALTGANGTVNVVGNVPVTLTGALGTVNLVGTPAVQLSGANGTVNVVGTVPVSLSAANGTVNIAGSATIAAGAAPNSGIAVLAVYNTAAPAPTSGQSAALQSDWSGNLFTAKRRSNSISAVVAVTGTQTLLAAQAAGVFADLAGVVISISSVTATGFCTYNLSDGTIVYPFVFDLSSLTIPSAQPFSAVFDPPLPATTTATPWVVRQGAGGTATAQFIGNFVKQKQA